MFLVFGLTEETFIVGGLSVFGAKLFQEFHNVNIADAGFIMGKKRALVQHPLIVRLIATECSYDRKHLICSNRTVYNL